MGVGRGFRVKRDRELRCEVRLSRSSSWSVTVSGGSGGRNGGDSDGCNGCKNGGGVCSFKVLILFVKLTFDTSCFLLLS